MQNQQSGLELYAKDEESVLESEKNKYRFHDCSEKSIFKGNFENVHCTCENEHFGDSTRRISLFT